MKIADSLDAYGIRVGAIPTGKGAWSLQLILPPTAGLAPETIPARVPVCGDQPRKEFRPGFQRIASQRRCPPL
jgi:hypothetical protein